MEYTTTRVPKKRRRGPNKRRWDFLPLSNKRPLRLFGTPEYEIVAETKLIFVVNYTLPGLDHGVVDVHGGRQQLARLGHLVETMHAGDALFDNAFEAVNFEDGIVFLNKKVGGITPVIEDHVGLPIIARKLQEMRVKYRISLNKVRGH